MEHLGEFIINHWQLCVAFVVILLLLFFTEIRSQKSRAKAILPQVAVNLMNNDHAVVIDLRDKEQFLNGHIIDAIQVDAADLENRMEKYKNKPVILTCAKGIQSAELHNTLSKSGFENLFVLQGGIDEWRNAGFPLVKGKTKPALRAV